MGTKDWLVNHSFLNLFKCFTYIYIYSLWFLLCILHCPLSGPDLIYISLQIIFCTIEYVTNKRALNLLCVQQKKITRTCLEQNEGSKW